MSKDELETLRKMVTRMVIENRNQEGVIDDWGQREIVDDIMSLLQQHTERAIREAVWQPYRERAQLVAALSLFYPSHTCTDDDEPDWMVVCVHTPEGQCGWHISQRDRDLFRHLDNQPNHYDGHSTDEKYSRLAAALTNNSKGE